MLGVFFWGKKVSPVSLYVNVTNTFFYGGLQCTEKKKMAIFFLIIIFSTVIFLFWSLNP